MKVIDEKGRLFGKINVVDFLVILFLFCLTPMFYFGYRIFKHKPTTEVKKVDVVIPIEIYADFKNLSPQVAGLVAVGDKELDSEGKVSAEVLEKSKIETNFIEIQISETDTLIREDAQRKQVTLKIELLGILDGDYILYKGNKVKIGSDISLKTAKYEIKGKIIPNPSQYEVIPARNINPITLDVLFNNLSPEVANLISVDDFEVDKNGDTIAKVLKVGPVEPYSYRVDLGGGNYITKIDPQKKQVQAKLEVSGGIHGNAFYFRGERIAIDSGISFNTEKYAAVGVILREPATIKKTEKEWQLVKIRFNNLIPELANIIKDGDMEKDELEGVIAKVDSIVSITPTATVVTIINEGKLSFLAGESNKDVVLAMNLSCIKGQNDLLFKDIAIKIGNTIPFQTDKYDIIGKIIEIKETDN